MQNPEGALTEEINNNNNNKQGDNKYYVEPNGSLDVDVVHIATEIDSEIESLEIWLSQIWNFGTDDEKALTKAVDHVFHSSTRLLCTKHLKDNAKHYLQDNVGMGKNSRRIN